jgi:biopolymer transport protein ExbD
MARGKASDRHKVEQDMPELNLNSMMDLFAVLIPALLMMSAVVEVTVLNVSAPAISSSDTKPPPPSDKPPLNLTVTIMESGYLISGQGGVLMGPGVNPIPSVRGQQPSIALTQKTVGCSRYRKTWPPPRSRNKDQPRCEKPEDQRSFWVYDVPALIRKIIEIKDAFPDERRITLSGEPGVEYESVIEVMDATRDVRDGASELPRPLFDEVILSPGV